MPNLRWRVTEQIVPQALLFLVLLLCACADDPPTAINSSEARLAVGKDQVDPKREHDVLNVQLRARLEALSAGEGFRYLKLPDSDDFANIPQDPLNPLTAEKVALGKLLYHETGMGTNNHVPVGEQTYGCATCHPAGSAFYSSLPQAIGEGGMGFGNAGEGRVVNPSYSPFSLDLQVLRTSTSLNVAFQLVTTWNGRFGAVGPNVGTEPMLSGSDGSILNNQGFHGPETQAIAAFSSHRLDIEDSPIPTNPTYISMFAAAFPPLGEINRNNAAMAMAAFERTTLSNDAPFQRWLRGERYAMTVQEVRGALLFFGKAGCVSCHNDPALGSMRFEAVGVNDLDGAADPRVDLRKFGGTIPDDVRKGRGGFSGVLEEEYAFKVPQLYNLADSRFYGHGSSFASVRDVVVYFILGQPQNPGVPVERLSPHFRPRGVVGEEIDDLVAFVEDALYDPNLIRYQPVTIPTGLCFPANDVQSQIDLGCTTSATRPPPDWQKRQP